MSKYNFQKAKKNNNKYTIYVNAEAKITGATFKSANEVFNAIVEETLKNGRKDEVSMAKVFDRTEKDTKTRRGFVIKKSNKKERIGEYIW